MTEYFLQSIFSSFQQTLGDEFTFQQDNNLKGQIYTGFAYRDHNISEWPSFDLNHLEKVWQDMKMFLTFLAMINNQLDRA